MRILLDESIPEKLGFTLGLQVAQYLGRFARVLFYPVEFSNVACFHSTRWACLSARWIHGLFIACATARPSSITAMA